MNQVFPQKGQRCSEHNTVPYGGEGRDPLPKVAQSSAQSLELEAEKPLSLPWLGSSTVKPRGPGEA